VERNAGHSLGTSTGVALQQATFMGRLTGGSMRCKSCGSEKNPNLPPEQETNRTDRKMAIPMKTRMTGRFAMILLFETAGLAQNSLIALVSIPLSVSPPL